MPLLDVPLGPLWKVGEVAAKWANSWLQSRKFRHVFGEAITKEDLTLVYAELTLERTDRPFPYIKPGSVNLKFSITHPVSSSELRASNHVASAVGSALGRAPRICSDVACKGKLDLDFVSFGLLSNFKTMDCLNNSANRLATFDMSSGCFIRADNGESICDVSDSRYDYGLILKIRPTQFPRRSWIVCGGKGEWGTSGAAWYLANRWQEIEKSAKDDAFAAIVSVTKDQDESAELLVLLKT